MGIVPGSTTLEEARQRIETINSPWSEYAVATENSSSDILGFVLYKKAKPAEMLWVVLTARTNAVIDTISFLFPFDRKSATPSMADWHTLFGVPSHLEWSPQTREWKIIYGDDKRGAAVVSMYANYSVWGELTWSLLFYDHVAAITADEEYAWPGFTRQPARIP